MSKRDPLALLEDVMVLNNARPTAMSGTSEDIKMDSLPRTMIRATL
jgi:hypothetical protein